MLEGTTGRGASGKTIVFGLLKRNGKLYTEIVPNCTRATLQAVIQGRVDLLFMYILKGVSLGSIVEMKTCVNYY